MEKLDKIVIEGYIGKWHEVDRMESAQGTLILLEHSTYGDETAGLIVDKNLKVVLDDVWNGFNDYLESLWQY